MIVRRLLALELLAAAVTLSTCGTILAAQSGIVNARIETRSASAGLEPAVRSVLAARTSAWIGYRVPMGRRPAGAISTTDWCCGRCRLEPPAELTVLARADMGAIVSLRAMAVDCDVDAAGMPVVWLTDVKPEESVAWLAAFVPQGAVSENRLPPLTAGALAAIGQHDARASTSTLIRFARESPSRTVRRQAMFWLGRSNDPRALEFLQEILLK